jgi:hypothetical protein
MSQHGNTVAFDTADMTLDLAIETSSTSRSGLPLCLTNSGIGQTVQPV